MPQGRPRKPTALKKLQGTLNTTREKRDPGVDVSLAQTSVILPEDAKVKTPKSLQTTYGKKYFKTLIKNLKTLHVLSDNDLPQIENLCITLEKLREVQEIFIQTSPFNEEFDLIEKRFTRLSQKFDLLASKYYISPKDRSQLKLQDLQLIKSAQEITKNDSAINNLLSARKIHE